MRYIVYIFLLLLGSINRYRLCPAACHYHQLTSLLYCPPSGALAPVKKQTFHSFLHFQNMLSFWSRQVIILVLFQLPVTSTCSNNGSSQHELSIIQTSRCLWVGNPFWHQKKVNIPQAWNAGRMSRWISTCTVCGCCEHHRTLPKTKQVP